MQAMMDGTRGLTLLINLNWDRLLYVGTVLLALLAGAWLGSAGLN